MESETGIELRKNRFFQRAKGQIRLKMVKVGEWEREK